jgi:hypothetical protein
LGDTAEIIKVQLQDGAIISFSAIRQLPFKDIDLAIVPVSEAEAGGNYAQPTDRAPSQGDSLTVWGYPVESGSTTTGLQHRLGQYIGLPANPTDGYELLYSSQTQVGFSGGPILNEQEQVVGIHGRAESSISSSGVQQRTGRALGIPISELIRRLSPSSTTSSQPSKLNLAAIKNEAGRIALERAVSFLSSASMSDQVLLEISKSENGNLPKYCTELAKAFYYTYYSSLPDLSRAKSSLTITTFRKNIPPAYYSLASMIYKKSGNFSQGLALERLAEKSGGRAMLQLSERQAKQSVLDVLNQCTQVTQ